jgi:hypothetical protein
MPWKESSVMDERMRFVIRLKDGESMIVMPGVRDFPQDWIQDTGAL